MIPPFCEILVVKDPEKRKESYSGEGLFVRFSIKNKIIFLKLTVW